MYFAWARAGAAAAVLACACTSTSATTDRMSAPPVVDGADEPVVKFDVAGALTAPPSTSVDIGVTIVGADTTVVLYLDGAYDDGWLSSGTVATVDGHAKVTLRTPSHAATFTMHARLGTAEAHLDVAVGDDGFADLMVVPNYLGHRSPTTLAASAYVRTTCADLAKLPIADGAPLTEASADASLTLRTVPAGAPIAVSVRAAHFARGCVDIDPLAPGNTARVKVPVYDVPLVLDQTDLHATHSFDATADAALESSALLDGAAARALEAFIPAQASEATVLLDAMQLAAPAPGQSAFASARARGGWDASAATWLSARAPTMRARAETWLDLAKDVAKEDLVTHIVSSAAAGQATVEVVSWGPLGAQHTGLTADGAFDWTADPDDTVHLSGKLALLPSVLLTYAADVAAAAATPGPSGVASALEAAIDCGGLAEALVGATESYPGCGASCTGTLCGAALAAMWLRATNASQAQNERVSIGMSTNGKATVDDAPTPSGFNGSWIATVTPTWGDAFALQGDATATR